MKIPSDIVKLLTNREITGRAAAKSMGISEQYFSLLVRRQKIKRIPGPTVVRREKAEALTALRREYRKAVVVQVAKGRKSIEVAAKEAKCSERTIYRHLQNIKTKYE